MERVKGVRMDKGDSRSLAYYALRVVAVVMVALFLGSEAAIAIGGII